MTVVWQLACLATLIVACMGARKQDVSLGKPDICDNEIVAKTCRDIDERNSPETVTAAEITDILSATRGSTIEALKHFDLDLEFNPGAVNGGDVVITCVDLCLKVVASIPEERMPPSSDVGCRHIDGEKTCDIDLSPEKLSEISFGDRANEFHAGHPVPHNPAYHEDDKMAHPHRYLPEDPLSIHGIKVHEKPAGFEEVTWQQAQIKLANLFRIYPITYISIDDLEDVDSGEGEEDEVAAPSFLESDEAETSGCQRMYCSSYSKSKMCAIPSCRSCKACLSKPPASHPSPQPRPQPPQPRPQPRPLPPPPQETESSASQPVINPEWAKWRQDVEKISIKSQAYVAQAIRQFKADRTIFRRWFGKDGPDERRKAMKVLNSLSNMLSNVAYIRNSPECSQNTYAFVYPYGSKSKNREGQFNFYLCPLYFRVDEGEKIETLTHEGSHHANSFTDDVCADNAPRDKCVTAYGRSTCKRLAQQFPKRAINNADSFCYYINDIAQA